MELSSEEYGAPRGGGGVAIADTVVTGGGLRDPEQSMHGIGDGAGELSGVTEVDPVDREIFTFCEQLSELIFLNHILHNYSGADPGFRRGGFVQEFRLENRSYPDGHDFSLRMQVIIAND